MNLKPTQRNANLDLIRALAILLVMYFHVTQMLARNLFTDSSLYIFGSYGVTIFFVLSGFLIGGIYFQRPNTTAFKFWLSRFLRTYPPYFVMMLVSWFAVYWARGERFDFGYLFLIQNFYSRIPYFLVSWSLAIEEQFYLLFSFLIFFVNNKRIQSYFWVLCIITPPFLRFLLYTESHEMGFHKTAPFLHMDSLATGVILAYLVYVKNVSLKVSKTTTVILLCITIVLFYVFTKQDNIYSWSFGNALINIFIGLTILCSYFSETFKIANTRFIKRTAITAFSLYLVHPLVIHFSLMVFSKFSVSNLIVQYIFTISLIYAVSQILYVCVEKTSLTYRDRIMKRYF